MGTRGIITAAALVVAGLAPVVAPDARAAQPQPIRPGPAVLYADAPAAPQLENRNPRFKADPILVMGHEAYVDGEYLYQDWIYDDNGADTGAQDAGGSDTAGDVEYPDDPAYAGNAADLVELRIAPGPRDVVYRFTLNTLIEPDTTIISLAVLDPDGSDGQMFGSEGYRGNPFSSDRVLTTWGTGADVTQVVCEVMDRGCHPEGRSVPAAVDVEANQITVTVPRALWNPTGLLELGVATGLYDPATGGYADPGEVYDLGLTFDEAPAGLTPHDAQQAAHLKSGPLPLHAVDFDALARRENRTSVPPSGTMGRIFPSRIDFGEGKDYDASPELLGRLQPYSIYVPTTYDASKPTPLMLDLHSLGEHHWQYNGSIGVQQIGEQRGAIVITCECRGEDGWYLDEAEYDTFEMWNDVNRHFHVDMNRVGITGYSMGGYATYRLASLYPDLFGKALSIVGPPTAGIWMPPSIGANETLTNSWLENVRNVPFLNAVGVPDELVPYYGTRAQNMGAPQHGIAGFDQLGYRFRFMTYPTAEHLTIGVLGYDLPYQREWLGDTLVEHDPTHVTFSYVPATDNAELGLLHDKAYWVSGIRLADAAAGELPKGTVDAFTHAHGRGDPEVARGKTAGHGPLPYVEENLGWGEPPVAPAANTLTLDLTNVGEVTIDLARAGLSLNGLELDVASTHRVTIHLVEGARVEHRVVEGG